MDHQRVDEIVSCIIQLNVIEWRSPSSNRNDEFNKFWLCLLLKRNRVNQWLEISYARHDPQYVHREDNFRSVSTLIVSISSMKD